MPIVIETKVFVNEYIDEMLHREFCQSKSSDINDLKGRTVSGVHFNEVNNKAVIYTYDGLTLEIILD